MRQTEGKRSPRIFHAAGRGFFAAEKRGYRGSAEKSLQFSPRDGRLQQLCRVEPAMLLARGRCLYETSQVREFSMNLSELSDFFAIEHLAKALWRDGQSRGAALLVGSGFSRFARTPSADSKKAPLWNDLR